METNKQKNYGKLKQIFRLALEITKNNLKDMGAAGNALEVLESHYIELYYIVINIYINTKIQIKKWNLHLLTLVLLPSIPLKCFPSDVPTFLFTSSS